MKENQYYIYHILNCIARVEESENYISLVLKCVSRVEGNAFYISSVVKCVILVERNGIHMRGLTLKRTLRIAVLLYNSLFLRNSTCNAHVHGARPGQK